MKYNDEIYKDSLNALIGDIYYAKDVSCDAKIARIRKLAEIIIRRLIVQDSNSALELGNNKTKRDLKKRGIAEKFFWNAFEIIHRSGNKATHSQNYVIPTEEDFNKVANATMDLYAYLFFNFFKMYKFGSNVQIVRAFSALPPLFRFIVLRELIYNNENNI